MGREDLEPDPTLAPLLLPVVPFDWLDLRPYLASLVCTAGDVSSSESNRSLFSLSLLLVLP